MCGIPHHAANIYIDKLIEKGYKVGICEQLEDPALAKGIVERDLIQIVSPGTIINQESLVDWDNNYIGNIIDLDYAYGVSYTDISTGEIKAFITDKNNNKVVSQILSIGIKEIVADSKVATEIIGLLKNQYKIVVTITDQINDYDYYDHIFTMDRDNQRCMKSMFGDNSGKIRPLMTLAGKDQPIPDPWYTGDFESTYRDICEALGQFLEDYSR